MDDGDLEALIDRARRGERDAQDEIVRRYEAHVRASLHGRIGRDLRARVETEDVLQSTMRASLEDLAAFEYRGGPAFAAWLARVAERRLLMAQRRHRAGARDVKRQVPLDAADDFAHAETSPPEAIARDESAARLRDAVARLPDAERRAVELRSYERLGFPEVARRLALSDAESARTLFRRALRSLAEVLGEKPR